MKWIAVTGGVLLVGSLANHFLLNNPESWGNYEACLNVEKHMTEAEAADIMGEPDFVFVPDHGRYDVKHIYNRYEFFSSGPILVKFSCDGNELRVVGTTCEDIW